MAVMVSFDLFSLWGLVRGILAMRQDASHRFLSSPPLYPHILSPHYASLAKPLYIYMTV